MIVTILQSYELSWSVDSYSPIEEYRLLYRKIKPYHGVSSQQCYARGPLTIIHSPLCSRRTRHFLWARATGPT